LKYDLRGGAQAGEIDEYSPIHFARNSANEYAAIRNRVTCPLAFSRPGAYRQLWREVKKNISLLGLKFKVRPKSFNQWLLDLNSTPAVKAKYARVYAELVAKGITSDTKLTRQQLSKWVTRDCFIKVENLLYRTPAGLLEKAPRMICGGTPEFMVLVGPFISAVCDRLKRVWNSQHFLTWSSGMTGEKIGKWMDDSPYKKWEEDDVSKFDTSVDEEGCKFEANLYEYWGAPLATRQLIRANIRCSYTTQGGIRYKRVGTRKSGDPYTSLGNTLINILMHFATYCRQHKISWKQGAKEVRILACGDDIVINAKRRTRWEDIKAEYGFKVVPVARKDKYDVTFCSAHFTPGQGGTVLLPNLARVVLKFGVFATNAHIPYMSLLVGAAKTIYKCMTAWPSQQKRVAELAQQQGGFIPRQGEWQPWLLHEFKPAPISSFYVKKNMFGGNIPDKMTFRLADFVTDGPRILYASA
jgi:hypothetical protein